MIENITFWVNGFGFGAFLICATSLLLVHRFDTKLRKPSLLVAITLYYLALRTVFSSFVPITSSMYLGHGPEFRAMLGMSTSLFVSLFMLELTHCRRVDWKFAITYFIVPVFIMLTFVIMASLQIESSLFVLFRVFALYILCNLVYNVIRTYKSYIRFEKELNNVYVNPQGRSVRWFWYVAGTMLLLFLGNVLASYYVDNTLPGDIYRFFCTFLWCFVAYRITLLRDSDAVRFESDPIEEDEFEPEFVLEVSKQSSADEPKISEEEAQRIRAEKIESFMLKLRSTLETKDLLFDEDLTRDDVTREMVVTHITLGKYLHEATGMTFAAYVCDLRLEHIARLLVTTDDNIDTIYYSCGFRSRTTFYRAFARKYNCSPVEYRRNNQSLSA